MPRWGPQRSLVPSKLPPSVSSLHDGMTWQNRMGKTAQLVPLL
jgi:hypothetical protein